MSESQKVLSRVEVIYHHFRRNRSLGEFQKGSYVTGIGRGYSINGDFITANYSYKDFAVDGLWVALSCATPR